MAVHLQRFTDQLYCSASELRQCVRPRSSVRENPGECLWFTTDNRPVTSADMQDRAKAIRHRWDAIQAGAVSAASFQRFDNRNAIVSCLRGKHILMTGESTTRDLFWELSAAAGFKVDRSWCMNLPDKKTALGKAGFIDKPCTRVAEDSASGSRLTFQFVSKANSTREVEVTRELLAGRPPDAVFAYCFGYDWYPTLMSAGDPGAKPEPDAMGSACMQHLDQAVRSVAPKVRTFLLGPTFPPAWVSPYENRTQPDSVMARIFRSINRAAGIRCHRAKHEAGGGGGGDGDFRVAVSPSPRAIEAVIDRYNIVGFRRRDSIHPTVNAHLPVMQLMLNHLCPIARTSKE